MFWFIEQLKATMTVKNLKIDLKNQLQVLKAISKLPDHFLSGIYENQSQELSKLT